MVTATPYFTWENALQEYLLHTKATRAKKTLRYYEVQLGQLAKWADANDVPFESFGKRHLDRYLIFRRLRIEAAHGTSRRDLRQGVLQVMCPERNPRP